MRTVSYSRHRFPAEVIQHAVWLGDISYAVYLWHFSLQLLIVHGMLMLGLPTSIFYRGELLCIFFVLLLIVSLVSYHALELPAQRWLRKKLLP
jgi:peptidoglycan/LPS O-acetylase OafA/YrhL